jgi:hypothetical protein
MPFQHRGPLTLLQPTTYLSQVSNRHTPLHSTIADSPISISSKYASTSIVLSPSPSIVTLLLNLIQLRDLLARLSAYSGVLCSCEAPVSSPEFCCSRGSLEWMTCQVNSKADGPVTASVMIEIRASIDRGISCVRGMPRRGNASIS